MVFMCTKSVLSLRIIFLTELTPSLSSAILFDGLLPKLKREERMQRLLATTKQLERYRLAYPEGVPRQRAGFDENEAVELFPKTRGKEAKMAAPPPSFLVASIIDALAKSPQYVARVKVMPGEADEFCAEHIRSCGGGLVLTSDSDLLVHDLGKGGGVVFFADIGLDADAEGLTAPQFRVEDICERLSLKPDHGLAQLAFELFSDPHLTIEQAAERSRRAVASTSSPTDYTSFLGPYLSPEAGPQRERPGESLMLDPRVSELAIRCLPEVGEPGIEQLDTRSVGGGNDLAIYLPFLLDYPVRTSAWEASKKVRHLAYSLLESVRGSRISCVAEFRRPQSSSSGVQVHCLTASETEKEGAALLDLLAKIETGISNPELTWVILSIYFDVELTVHQGKECPLSFELLRQYILGTLDQGSWDYLHFLAQVQALLYSLRILKQLMEFTAYHASEGLSPMMAELRERLAGLPPLTAFPSVRSFGEIFRKFGKGNGLDCLGSLFSEREEVLEQIDAIQRAPTPKKGRRPNKRKVSMSKTAPVRPLSKNPFDVLAAQD